MNKRCAEHNCPNNADTILPIDMGDRREFVHLCSEHYAEAVVQITKVKDSIVNMSRDEMVRRLKELLSPEEFNKRMEEMGMEDREYVN